MWWLAAALATGLGSGFCPVAPATLGSAVALGIYWLVPLSGDSPGLFALIAAGLAVGPLAINRILSAGETDPSRAVWDEFVGMWTACLYLPKEWPWLLAAFFTFRALDIAKPLGVRRFERLPGGLGVMADDLVAGFVAAGILNAIRLAFFA
ncbi:MAG: phosphatidylglycerophosphatase A [Gemmatimonadetes bacterium]|nr:phosphatidylglycerophosphatase A [Gemmatimonadota bacterium]